MAEERTPRPVYHVLPYGAEDAYGNSAHGYPVVRDTQAQHVAVFVEQNDARLFALMKNFLTEIHGTDALPLSESSLMIPGGRR